MVRCPQLVQWLLGYSDFGGPKERENIDNKIRAFLTGRSRELFTSLGYINKRETMAQSKLGRGEGRLDFCHSLWSGLRPSQEGVQARFPKSAAGNQALGEGGFVQVSPPPDTGRSIDSWLTNLYYLGLTNKNGYHIHPFQNLLPLFSFFLKKLQLTPPQGFWSSSEYPKLEYF